MEIVEQSLKDEHVREAKEEIPSLGGKVNWVTINKDLFQH